MDATAELGGMWSFTRFTTLEGIVVEHLGEDVHDYDVAGLVDEYREHINDELEDCGLVMDGEQFYRWCHVAPPGDYSKVIRAAINSADLQSLAAAYELQEDVPGMRLRTKVMIGLVVVALVILAIRLAVALGV